MTKMCAEQNGDRVNWRWKERLVYKFTPLKDIQVESLTRAAIFYHGVWSGPSVAVLQVLSSTIAESSRSVELLVVNADEIDDEQAQEIVQQLFGTTIGAWGETCWIRGGKVIERDVLFWKGGSDSEWSPERGPYDHRTPASAQEIQQLVKDRLEQLY